MVTMVCRLTGTSTPAWRHRQAPVRLDTILGPIGEREASGRRTADQPRTQITTLTSELARIDAEPADLETTRATLRALATTEFTADDPTVTGSAYQ